MVITYLQLSGYFHVCQLSPERRERVNQLFACYCREYTLYVWMFSAIGAGVGFSVLP